MRLWRRTLDAGRWIVWGTKVLVRGTRDLISLFRAGGLAEALEPELHVRCVEDIPFDRFRDDGVEAVLFDLENTLIRSGGPFTDEARQVVDKAMALGLKVGVVSNASASWVKEELDRESIPFVAPAGKPGRDAFERGCALVGSRPASTVFVGDQMITDVLGSQRAGLRAVLVDRRYASENLSARFQRVVAKLARRFAR